MTVMPSGSDVADKAVSTEDTSEIIHLDAVLAALVETKIESIKRASLSSSSKDKWISAPDSPRRPRLMSSSTTASSSQNRSQHQHHHHHHHHHYHHQHALPDRHIEKFCIDAQREHKNYRHRRYDSAPCEKFLDELNDHTRYKRHDAKAHSELIVARRASEFINRNSKSNKKRRVSRNISSSHALHKADSSIELPELLDVDRLPDDLTLINFAKIGATLNDNEELPRLHQSAYISQSAAHINKLTYEDEDYVALNLGDELDGESIVSGHYTRDNSREHENDIFEERYHRPRRKRKRKKNHENNFLPGVSEIPQVVLIDHDELPLRARWTIVATACLLFAMSLLLVGVTLRMAPIIDDMVRKENEELLNALNRDTSVLGNSTMASF